MPVLPTVEAAADLHSWKLARSEYAGPKPFGEGPLARLIVSSLVERSTEPADSVRAAQAAEVARVLIRKRQQISSSLALQEAFRGAGFPNIVQVLTRQIGRLQRAR